MRKVVLLLSFVSMFLITGCSNDSKVKVDSNATKPEKVSYVKTEKVKNMDFLETSSLPGVVKPFEEVIITGKVNGTAKKIYVGIGDKVSKNQTLLKIDDEQLRLQYEKALSSKRNGELTLDRLQNHDVNSGEMPQAIENAQAQYEISRINFEKIEDSYNSAKVRYQNVGLTREEYLQIEQQYKIAKVNMQQAKDNLAQAKRNWTYDVQGAKLSLEVASKDINLLKLNLDNTDIKSPIDGFISSKKIEEGEVVSPGFELFKVINIQKVYFESGLSENELKNITPGMKVNVNFESLGKKYEGLVVSVNPQFDENSKTYPFKVVVDNLNNELKPGMFGNVEFIKDERKASLSTLSKAVFIEGDQNFVYMFEKNTAIKKPVKIGISNGEYVEILDGVDKNSLIIVEGISNIKDGSRVDNIQPGGKK